MGEARGDPLQSAWDETLQEEGVADFSEADRHAMVAKEDFWSIRSLWWIWRRMRVFLAVVTPFFALVLRECSRARG